MFRKMPIILIMIIFAIALFDNYLLPEVKSFCFAISLSIKTAIIFVLPFVIFSLLFKTAVQLAKQATKIIFLILVAVCCSNFLSTFLSHYVGTWIYHFDFTLGLPLNTTPLKPTWTIELPKLIANDKAMLTGLLLGIGLSFIRPQLANTLANKLDKIVTYLLKGITYLVPWFVAGFVIKLNAEGGIKLIAEQYVVIFALILVAQFTYILLLYFLANRCKVFAFLSALKNMLPATITGLSTMSSAAAMPLTLLATEKNTGKSLLARALIPTTVNIHLIGDCFAIPILAYAVLKSYGMAEPVFYQYLIFACYFVLAKFSVAAVPGGGIIVMLPILEYYLGFNAEMLSLITALYILFDPIITCANVLGNGAFAMMMNQLQNLFSKQKSTPGFDRNFLMEKK